MFLWKGSPSTKPIDFGISTIVEDSTQTNLENTANPMAMQLQDDLTCNSKIDDTADTDGLESHLQKRDTMKSQKRKANQVGATKQFVDAKREKLQGKLGQRAKQDVLPKHSQRDIEIKEQLLFEIKQENSDDMKTIAGSMSISSLYHQDYK